MLGFDLTVAIHQLSIINWAKLVKQAQRHFHPKRISQIKVRVNKVI